MDNLSRLPVECLQLILDFIFPSYDYDYDYDHDQGHEPNSIRTLLSLCLVNRHMALVTLPYLYRDPFQLLYMTPHSEEGRPRSLRERNLLRTLLTNSRSNPSLACIHPAVASELDIDITTPTSKRKIRRQQRSNPIMQQHSNKNNAFRFDYLAHVRNLTPPRNNYRKWDRHDRLLLFNYLEQPNFSKVAMKYIHSPAYLAFCPPFRADPDCNRHSDPDMMLLYLYPIVVYRELIWSLSVPILEQLESLTLPLSDVQRYHNVLHRLRNLKWIHIVKDLKVGCRVCGYGNWTNIQESTTKEANDSLAQFLKDYALVFPGHRLDGVTCSLPGYHGEDWHNGIFEPPSLKHVDMDIIRALPPPNRLKVISPNKWPWIALHLHRTDMTLVRSIDWLPCLPDDYWRPARLRNFKPQRLLRWCRALESLVMKDLYKGCFDWAVEEKKDLQRLEQGAIGSQVHCGNNIHDSDSGGEYDDEAFHPDYFTHGLVPLAKVHLENCSMPSPDLDALIYAFSQSLESLLISSLQAPLTLPMIPLGRNWVDLPLLSHLEIHAANHRLVLDQHSFSRFPSLHTLILLDDNTLTYSCEDIVPCYAADRYRLETLRLTGWSALTFHPATLESTKALKMLCLANNRFSDRCFIPPVDELYRSYGLECTEDNSDGGAYGTRSVRLGPSIIRPHWTWDWYLPCLTYLSLGSEFAYRFEFKMLRGCPALEKLYLHIFTSDSTPHYRIISENDLFFIPSGTSGADGSCAEERGRIVVPKLHSLHMEGRWSCTDSSVLHQFLVEMFPCLDRLTVRGCWAAFDDDDGPDNGNRFTVATFVKLLRTSLSHVGLLTTDIRRLAVWPSRTVLSKEELERLRIFPLSYATKKRKDGKPEYTKGPKLLANRFICSGLEYVLMKEKTVRKKRGKSKQK
ncbi:hypothetical protein EC957_010902 [Mortierella hygrophila]|uniref:Uncharacterized protein n=1 Tax=Mortierella hygrophila TaxID=979708 RepID=A0A9P6FA42_9FUNG|nr:hypothetical protein EC957_010902 [Mortierella hygrophila]